MKKIVIFDMDVVLIDSEKVYAKWAEEFLLQNGATLTEETRRKLVGSSYLKTGCIMADAWPCPISPAEVLERFRESQKKHSINYREIMVPQAETVLHNLSEKGLILALASSSPTETIEKVMHQTELGDYFDLIVSGEEFEESKPNPEIYLSVLGALNCTAEECIVVEDSEYGIAAGKAAGIYVVARRESELPVCQKEADVIIDSLDEIETCLGRFDRGDI